MEKWKGNDLFKLNDWIMNEGPNSQWWVQITTSSSHSLAVHSDPSRIPGLLLINDNCFANIGGGPRLRRPRGLWELALTGELCQSKPRTPGCVKVDEAKESSSLKTGSGATLKTQRLKRLPCLACFSFHSATQGFYLSLHRFHWSVNVAWGLVQFCTCWCPACNRRVCWVNEWVTERR